jgi:hypothetical protein
MVGYKGARISVPEMLNELVQGGLSPVDAGLQIRRAFEDGRIGFLNESNRSRTPLELSADIERLASAYGARIRGEKVLSSEVVWQMYLKDVFIERDLFETIFGLKKRLAVGNSKRGAKEKFHWDLIETEMKRLMDHHGDFDASDPEWNAQARLEEALQVFCQRQWREEPSVATLRTRLPGWLADWRARK